MALLSTNEVGLMPVSPELKSGQEKASLSPCVLEGDYIEKLPELHYLPDKMRVKDVKSDLEIKFRERLRNAGLTRYERTVVSFTLHSVYFSNRRWLTIGELRRLTDEELMELGQGKKKVGPTKTCILRKLFGRIQEEDIEATSKE